MFKHQIVTTATACFLAAVGIAIAGEAGGSNGSGTRTVPPSNGYDQARADRGRSEVAALRRSRGAADEMPERVASGPLNADAMADADRSRQVRGGSRAMWIAPSSDGASICALRAGYLSCPSVDYLSDHGLSPGLSVLGSGQITVTGIASDAVSSVELVLADGSSAPVTVSENAFAVDVSSVPHALRWTGPNGAEEFVFPAVPGLSGR